GRGQYVDVSMTDGALALVSNHFSTYTIRGQVPRRGAQTTNGGAPYYGVYECSDGKWISLGIIEPRFWEAMCKVLGREDLIPAQDDPARAEELRTVLTESLRTKTRDEWFEVLSKNEVCVGRVLEIDELPDDPQLRAREMFVEVEGPDGERYKQVGSAFKLSDTPATVRRLAPLLGQHTEEILSELGYSSSDAKSLRSSGAVS
ncbi:MAG: CoA transferase, partial [Chloroflexi bacterium]|nr:CoA transferase [Chloroflexota bacterium]